MEAHEEKTYGRMPNNCTLKEYRKHYAPEGLRRNVQNLAMVGYLLGAVNLGAGVWNMAPVGIAIAAAQLALTLGMHLNKSRLCAIGIMVIACGDLLLSFLTGGSLTTWGWVALGVCAISAFNGMDKAFRKDMERRNRIYE